MFRKRFSIFQGEAFQNFEKTPNKLCKNVPQFSETSCEIIAGSV